MDLTGPMATQGTIDACYHTVAAANPDVLRAIESDLRTRYGEQYQIQGLRTGAAALDLLRQAGATRVRIVCIVAAPEGVRLVEERHPDVTIFTPVVDRCLNDQKYIVPGLGDFGDRLYGTP